MELLCQQIWMLNNFNYFIAIKKIVENRIISLLLTFLFFVYNEILKIFRLSL